jgi:hypothetical protein
MIPTLANSLWLASCLPEHARFHRDTRNAAAAQRTVLLGILRANAATEFGKTHGFASITTPADTSSGSPSVTTPPTCPG